MTNRSHGDGGIDKRGESTYRLRYRIGKGHDQKNSPKHSTARLKRPERSCGACCALVIPENMWRLIR